MIDAIFFVSQHSYDAHRWYFSLPASQIHLSLFMYLRRQNLGAMLKVLPTFIYIFVNYAQLTAARLIYNLEI